jgi:5-methyltetrahydrofolate--homocysteine methyltransferase
MCATLSGNVDKLLRTNELSNMVNALIIDALANAAIEQVCDEVEKIFLQDFKEYNSTWRFGVGYGDFPLTTQKLLLETLDAGKRIGVCATESCILTPRKSVTCIVGLSKNNVNSVKSCDTCNLKNTCNLRKNGTSCSK